MRRTIFIATATLLLIAGAIYSQRTRRPIVGPTGDGAFLLNTGWSIRPAGSAIPLSTLPMSQALSPNGRVLAVLNGGYNPASVSLLDLDKWKELARIDLGDGWRGLAFSKRGDRLYAGNGSRGSIAEITIDGASTKLVRKIDLFPGETPGVSHLISDIVALDKEILAIDGEQDQAILLNQSDATILRRFPLARNPYAALPAPDGKSIFVSSWSTAHVIEYSLADGHEISNIETGPHPTEMTWLPPRGAKGSDDDDEHGGPSTSQRLAVACANTNLVYVLEKSSAGWKVAEKVNLAFTPRQPVGMTPSALSLSPDQKRLYVACSDANAIAVVDISGTGRVLGYIPTGWYPTSVRALANGDLVILNGKGEGSHANPDGPNPNRWPVTSLKTTMQYVASIQGGSASILGSYDDKQLESWTQTVMANTAFRDTQLDHAETPAGNPVPGVAGSKTPIKHVILLMKENRTYDQVLGDLKEGNGDPNLVLFGENITPNHHALAREFVLLDNFYVNADVSSDGYYWTTAAISPDSNQRLWPMEYARRVYAKLRPNPEGLRSAPGGHIWDRAAEARVSFYNYGFSAINLPHPPEKGIQIQEVEDPVLKPHTSYYFRQHDRSFSDINRIQVFLDDLAKWEKSGDMPQLILMTIGNDHTEGMRAGERSPISCVADNDQSFGVMVEGLTKSKFWSSTAMFVLEDDAQDGADHVDSHRSIAYVISPYTRRGSVDSTLYNTTSVLRTIELLLGLKPMTMFDAAARPMSNAFQNTPNLKGYKNLPPRVSLTMMNPANTTLAARSEKMDFSKSDLIDDHELNDILWLAIRGTSPPAPVRSRFSK
jgi:DNA-binding beta-propeller fold protein YncE